MNIQFLKNRKVIISFVFGILFILAFVFMPRFFVKNTDLQNFDDILSEESIYNPVNVNEAEELYTNVTNLCEGVTILEQNERVCKSQDDYKMKLFGYSYEGDDVVLYVKVMQNINGVSFDLTGKQIGNYESDRESDLLESGTTYLYYFEKVNTDYEFKSLQIMNV